MANDDVTIRDNDEPIDPENLQIDENEDFFPKYYDLEKVFDESIYPLLKTIVNICNEYNIPMVTSFQYANEQKKAMLCTSVVVPPRRTCDKLTQTTKILLN